MSGRNMIHRASHRLGLGGWERVTVDGGAIYPLKGGTVCTSSLVGELPCTYLLEGEHVTSLVGAMMAFLPRRQAGRPSPGIFESQEGRVPSTHCHWHWRWRWHRWYDTKG